MSQVETSGVSTGQDYEEYMRDREMQSLEEDVGVESLVEMTALDDETRAELSASLDSTCYEASLTVDYATSLENLTDSLLSVYEDNEQSEIDIECPTYFAVSSISGAVAMDSIEALDALADFVPIPVDFSKLSIVSTHELLTPTELQPVTEYTCRVGDTDSTTTSPYHDYYKDAAITEPADLTSFKREPSETDVTVAAADEGLVENEDYSVYSLPLSEKIVEMCDGAARSPTAADFSVYSYVEKSQCDVEISCAEDYSVYSIPPSERCIEMLDTHSIYSNEGRSEIECDM